MYAISKAFHQGFFSLPIFLWVRVQTRFINKGMYDFSRALTPHKVVGSILAFFPSKYAGLNFSWVEKIYTL